MRYSHSHVTGAAFALMTATVLTACAGGDDETAEPTAPAPGQATAGPDDTAAPEDTVAAQDVEIRRVALFAAGADEAAQMIAETDDIAVMLAELNLEDSPSTTEAVEWFSAGDCDAEPVLAPDVATACSADGSEVFLLGPVGVDGTQVAEADYVEDDAAGNSVNLTFDEEGTLALAALTEVAMVGEGGPGRIAITVEGEVFTAPTVQSVIENGQVSIVGGPDQDLRSLAAALG